MPSYPINPSLLTKKQDNRDKMMLSTLTYLAYHSTALFYFQTKSTLNSLKTVLTSY
jgi:hypothetical protein